MLSVYEDKLHNDPIVTEAFKSGKRKVNIHASTLVIECINRMYDKIISLSEEILN